MNSLTILSNLALLQPEPLKITTNAIQFFVTTSIILLGFIVAVYYVLKSLRKDKDHSVVAEVRGEFEKSKKVLLLSAQQKKAAKKGTTDKGQEVSREAKEIELLKENVDPSLIFGKNCPLSSLEMLDDQELVIDPYTGQGYHFSSFLNDWPVGNERPKYVYRYPQKTVVKSSDLLTGF